MPKPAGGGGRPFRDHRQVVEAIIWRYRAGAPWRDLPESFGSWKTVWKRHRRFSADGTWDAIHAALLRDADAAGEIDRAVSVDSTANRAIRTTLRRRRITAVIPQPRDQIAHRLRRGRAGGRPPGFDRDDYRGRNVVERSFCDAKQWRGIATRYDKLSVVYRGGAVLNAIHQ